MKIKINLKGCKPLSLNNAYTITAKYNKVLKFPSASYKKLESSVNSELRANQPAIRKFNKYYDKKKHYLTVDWIFYYPILNKGGAVSGRSGDCSNSIKVIEDIVFKNLTADDSQCVSISSSKIHSENIRTEIEINIKDLKSIA